MPFDPKRLCSCWKGYQQQLKMIVWNKNSDGTRTGFLSKYPGGLSAADAELIDRVEGVMFFLSSPMLAFMNKVKERITIGQEEAF